MFVLDIETVPTEAAMAIPYNEADNPPPSNYSKPEAIAGHHDKGRAAYAAKRAKECSLNPRLGRVLCLGYCTKDGTPSAIYAQNDGEDEAKLLREFWELAFDHAAPLVTWNGSWDLRFLWIRSLRHRVAPTLAIGQFFKKYTTTPHCDVKAVLMQDWNFRQAGEGMDEWAHFMGLPSKPEGMDGSTVYANFLAGKHTEIQEYCLHDVRTTLALYRAIQPSL